METFNTRKSRRKTGFTLVEAIVVLVILAILAVLLIPALTGWIDRARQGQAQAECRSCVLAAQGVASEKYAAGAQYSLSADKADTLKLADVPAATDILSANVAAGVLTNMQIRSSNGLYVTYENGMYRVSETGVDLSSKDTLNSVFQIFKNTATSPSYQYYSSGKNMPSEVVDALKAQGIDLSAAGVTAWAIRNEDDNGWPKLYWTTQKLTSNADAYVISYSFEVGENVAQKGNYNVWKAHIGGNGTESSPYYIKDEINGTQVYPDIADQTYDKAVAEYKRLTGQ